MFGQLSALSLGSLTTYSGYGRAHRTLTERARQALRVVKRRLPARRIVVTADRSFSALEFLAAVSDAHLSVVARLRLDAALYEPAPIRRPGQNGRPRKKGPRRSTLTQLVADPTTRWHSLTVEQWYGQSNRTIEIASETALWFHAVFGKQAI